MNKFLALSTLAVLAVSSAVAQITVTWGNSDEALIFADSSGVALDTGSIALIGSFAPDTDFVTRGTDLAYLQTKFVQLGASSVSSGGYDGLDGYFTQDTIVNSLSTKLYYWIFNSTSAATATEWGIVTSTSWVTPANAPDSLLTDMSQVQVSDVKVGDLNAVSGVFRTIVVSAIPEPSSFAALAGLGILGVVATRRRRSA